MQLFAQSLDNFYRDMRAMERRIEAEQQAFMTNLAATTLLICIGCGVLGSIIGRQKGQGQLGWWLGFLLGPIGLIVVALLPANPNARVQGLPPVPQNWTPPQPDLPTISDDWLAKSAPAKPPQNAPPPVYDELEEWLEAGGCKSATRRPGLGDWVEKSVPDRPSLYRARPLN